MDLTTPLELRPYTRTDASPASLPPTSTERAEPPVAPNRLQALREARGLTLRELAERVGASRQHMSSLERGARRLTTDWLLRLADGLECHPCEILALDEPEGVTRRERLLLAYLRRLDEGQQQALMAFLSASVPRRRRDRAIGTAV